jgi:transposase
MYEHFPFPACRVEQVTCAGPERVELAVRATQPEACCPTCLTPSNALHSYYRRHPADLPSLGQAVCLNLSVRRFYCRNPACPRQTFAEPLPELLSPRARRTQRLATAQAQVGIALGGEAGARLLHRLAMPSSADTLLRLVRGLPLPTAEAPRVVGVDEWALKKGQRYGTILVDLENRRVADLLPERTAPALAAWLQERGSVEVIARDRSGEYARGATLGAPAALQVADRWHLLDNLRPMLARWLAGLHGRLGQLPPVVGTEGLRVQRTGVYPRTRAEEVMRAQSRARRLALYEEVRRRVGAGETLLAISRALGLARATVRRYAGAPSFPERAARRLLPSKLDPYLGHLEARWAAGCQNALGLWRELRALGFAGSSHQVRRWARQRRTVPAGAVVTPSAPVPPLPSPRQLAWLLVQAPEELDAAQTASLARIVQDEEVARVAELGRRLAGLVRSCGAGRDQPPVEPLRTFGAWLEEACSCGVAAVERFAAALQQEAAAVRAALTLPWSSGQTEGHITKVKLIKRQMYGRANFDLLRRRVLLVA